MRGERKTVVHYASSPQLWSAVPIANRLRKNDVHQSGSSLHWAYQVSEVHQQQQLPGQKESKVIEDISNSGSGELASFKSRKKEAVASSPSEADAVKKIREKYDNLRNLKEEEEEEEEAVMMMPPMPAEDEEEESETTSSQPSHDTEDTWGEALSLSDQDRFQVELFFRGHKTQVYVCSSLANLYTSSCRRSSNGGGGKESSSSWELKYTGIPVLLLDYGQTRSRDRRRIQLLLAEKGTGFMLWRDTIDNLSSYKAVQPTFHTMHLSTDHRQVVGLSFDEATGAQSFLEQLERLTSDPANISLTGPGSKGKKKSSSSSSSSSNSAAPSRRQQDKTKVVLPRKSDISQPCCFQHVTNVEASDRTKYFSLQAFLPNSTQPPSTSTLV